MPRRSAIKITKTRVDDLKPGETLWDAEIPGFGVSANAHSKSYKLKFYFNRRQRMLTLGSHGPLTVDQARKLALAAKAKINAGIDPAEKATPGVTVAQLCEEYLEKHARVNKKPGSVLMDAANIKNHIVPLLGNLPVADVTSTDIENFKLAVQSGKTAPSDPKAVQKSQRGGSPVTGGKGVANRCLALLSKMFNLAERWGQRAKGSNPVRGVSKFKERPKERYLDEAELKRLWDYMDQLQDEGAEGMQFPVALIRLLILTGARCGEIQNLKWSMVDLQAGTLRLSDSKTGSKTIWLSDRAVQELKRLPRVKDNPYVIVGAKDGKPLQNIRKPWNKIRKAVGLEDVRIHDLRHSFASIAAANGVDLHTIGKLLGHKHTATTQRYAHLTDKHMVAANKRIADALGRAFNPGSATASSQKNG